MNVLYISYDGALDNLGSSQIVPYLVQLSKKGAKITFLTYEKKDKLKDTAKLNKIHYELKKAGIEWRYLKYHKKPTLLATSFDIIAGIFVSFYLTLRNKIQIIHVRSFIGAIPGLIIANLPGRKLLYDLRGFWPEERIEGGIWTSKGIVYKVAKFIEAQLLHKADEIVCLTNQAKNILLNECRINKNPDKITVIPTCVDLNKFNIVSRNEALVSKLHLADKFVFVYVGSLGTWYLFDQLLELFKIAKKEIPNSFFLIITPECDYAVKKVQEKQFDKDDYFITYVQHSEMSNWLSVASIASFFIKPTHSKKSSCPTKFAEFLASGLPVITNSGIGDLDSIIGDEKVGVIINEFNASEYKRSINEIVDLLKAQDVIKNRCRNVASKIFSLEKGVDTYFNIYSKMAAHN